MRRLIVLCWLLSISEPILFSAYTLSDKEPEGPYQMIVEAGKKASFSFLGLFTELARAIQNNSSDAPLADIQDEGLEKIEFIASRYLALKIDLAKTTILPAPGYPRPEVPALATISPPPEG